MKVIIRILSILSFLGLMSGYGHAAALLNNSGATSEDSLSVVVMSLDSLGNPTTADSFFVAVFKSGANLVVFSDSGTTAMTGLDTVTTGGGLTHYYYHRAVADIDGGGATGLYSGVITAKRNSGPLLTANRFSFQIIKDDFSSILDSLYAIIDTLQNHANWTIVPADTNLNGDTLAVTGTNQVLRLRGLHVKGTSAGDTAVIFQGNTTGPGFVIGGGTSGNGLEVLGGTVSGHGMYVAARAGNSNGIQTVGFGDGDGMAFVAGATGNGIYAVGGSTSGDGARIIAQAGNGFGFRVEGQGSGSGISAVGGSSGSGIEASGQGGGHGIDATGGATSGHGAYFNTTASVAGFKTLGGTGASGTQFVGGSGIGGYGAEFIGSGGIFGRGLILFGGAANLTIEDTTYDGRKLGLMPDEWSATDSTGFQGQASGLTAATIWNYATKTITGGLIDSNLTEQGGIAGGNLSLLIYTIDTSGVDDTLDGVFVTIQNESGVVKSALLTNSSGMANEIVTSGNWKLLASSHGYAFPDTQVSVSTNDTVAVLGYDLVVPPPSSGSVCRVFGYLYDLNQQPQPGVKISAHLPSGVSRLGSTIVSPVSVATLSDSVGYFFLDLIPSDSLNPVGSVYEFTISRKDGTILRKRLAVPAQPTWQLSW